MKKSYQLTRFPIGSIRELWTVSLPLILSFMSMSIMLFSDRWLLSLYSIHALDASAVAGTASFSVIVLPLTIAAISEVFVGRFHGEGRNHDLGKPVWQMIWFSLMLFPLFFAVAAAMPPYFFSGSPNIEGETAYFSILMLAAPLFITCTAITGFFVGTGKVRVVTLCAVIANAINIPLDYLFINGWGPIPEMGVGGAAFATAAAQFVQTTMLMMIFLNKRHRRDHGTTAWNFDKELFIEAIKIGFPSGLGISLEIFVHYLFFRLMAAAGPYQLSIAAIAQSFFFLIFFSYEGLSKGVTTICANLHGGRKEHLIAKVLKSAVTIHTLFSIAVSVIVYFFLWDIVEFFLNNRDEDIFLAPERKFEIAKTFFWLCMFYFFDGLVRVFIGQLTAAGDTKFILFSSITANLCLYLGPLAAAVYLFGAGAAVGWMLIALYGFGYMTTVILRYLSGGWKQSSNKLHGLGKEV